MHARGEERTLVSVVPQLPTQLAPWCVISVSALCLFVGWFLLLLLLRGFLTDWGGLQLEGP